MKLLNRYIFSTVLKSILLILLVLIAMDTFVEVANEMRFLGRGTYTILTTLAYVPLIIPQDVYHFFPIIGLIGALVGLGVLSNNSELIIMRASGFSIGKIAMAVAVSAIVLSLVMGVIGEYIAPKLQRMGDAMKATAIHGQEALTTEHGIWMRSGNSFIHINTVLDQHKLMGVTRYDFNDASALETVRFAKTLSYVSHHWEAEDVAASHITSTQVRSSTTASEPWDDIELNPRVLSFRLDDPLDMTITQLWSFVKYRHNVGLASTSYQLAFWQRIFQPLATVVMILLAIPFVFGSLRSGTMGLRVMVGVILGLTFYLLNQFSGQISLVYDIPPFVSAFAPVLLFMVLGLVLMRRVN